MWRAEYQSKHFCFEAYGETEEETRAYLLEGLRTHGKQCGLPDDWFHQDEVCPVEIFTGVFRDGIPLMSGLPLGGRA